MLAINEKHVAYIRRDLTERGILLEDLNEDLIDHICCQIESSGQSDFETAYRQAIASFGEEGFIKLQIQTYRLVYKKEIIMKKFTYLAGYLATTLSTTGILFKFMHWPGANIMILLGIVMLNFIFLPMYFYKKYKSVDA